MTNSKHVPKRRFKEFGLYDEWALLKLDEVAKYRNGKAHENSISLQGKFIVVNSKFISTNGEVKKFTDLQIEPIFKNEISFVLSDVPNGRAIARTFLIDQNDKYTLNQRIAAITPNRNISPYYLYVLLNRNKYFLEFDDGVKQTNLSKADVLEFKEYYPISKEQFMIGDFFQTIDSLLTLHQHKLDKLKNLKKSYLAELFPAEGERVPKRRFPGFEGEWEEKNLGSLCEVFTDGDWIETKDQSDSGVRLLQTGNVGITEYLDKSSNTKWISEKTFEKLHCKEVLPGDILISRLPEPAGRACIIPNVGQKMITSVDCTIVRTKSEVSSSFLVQYLSSALYFNAVATCLAGGTRQRISRSNLANISIVLPTTKTEQKKIGDFFNNLDKSISLQQQKLDKLKDLKKAYLNELFV